MTSSPKSKATCCDLLQNYEPKRILIHEGLAKGRRQKVTPYFLKTEAFNHAVILSKPQNGGV